MFYSLSYTKFPLSLIDVKQSIVQINFMTKEKVIFLPKFTLGRLIFWLLLEFSKFNGKLLTNIYKHIYAVSCPISNSEKLLKWNQNLVYLDSVTFIGKFAFRKAPQLLIVVKPSKIQNKSIELNGIRDNILSVVWS